MTRAGLLEAETLTAALLLCGRRNHRFQRRRRLWGCARFDQPFHIRANLALGRRLSEENNAKGLAAASFPAQFAIDWIRVYRCGSDPEKGRACMR
jgi:hypothetical protein